MEEGRRDRLVPAALLALGLTLGGALIGNGFIAARGADRAVTVRGVAEREVTADLASWSIAYSATAGDLNEAKAKVAADTAVIRQYFARLGFPASALSVGGVGVNQSTDQGMVRYTVTQRLQFRSTDIKRAQAAVARQFELLEGNVGLAEGSVMQYSFTKLDSIKPPMVAAATVDARKAAEQFAKDSGARVGRIKSATQGYFEITPRDGAAQEGGYGVSDTPFKKVRVVTTVQYVLD